MIAMFLTASATLGFSQQTATGSQQAATSSQQAVTLDQAVAAALASAPGLTIARVSLDTARSQLTQVQATNGLSLSARSDYSHQGDLTGGTSSSAPSASAATAASGSGLRGDTIQGGLDLSGPSTSVGLTAQHSITPAPSDQVSGLSLSASQTVFDGYPGGRSSALVQEAEDTYRIAQVAYDATQKSVTYQVKQAYYTLLADQETLQVRQVTVQQAQDNLTYYQGLLQAGRATSLEVLQVQVTLTQAQLDLRTTQNAIDSDRKRLSLAVGWPLDRQYTAADSPLPQPPSVQTDQALQTAFQNRAELRTFALEIASANLDLALQNSQKYPVVSINGSLGVGQDWTASSTQGSFAAGVSVALPVVDGGLRSAEAQQAADSIASFKAQQDQEQQGITIDVENALFSVTDTRERLDLAQQNVQQAQGQYDLEKAKYAVGLETTLDVLTAFSALTTAQVGLEQARNNYVLAVLNLDNVMGL